MSNNTFRFIVSLVAILIAFVSIGVGINQWFNNNKRMLDELKRWRLALNHHKVWFSSHHAIGPVLENIEMIVEQKRSLNELPLTAFELSRKLWGTQAEEALRVFKRLAGRGMHELRFDELSAYITGVAVDRGIDSYEFQATLTWLVGELQRKTNDEGIAAVTASRAVEERDRALRDEQITLAELTRLREELNEDGQVSFDLDVPTPVNGAFPIDRSRR